MNPVSFVDEGDAVRAVRPQRRYRFMFDDGSTLDVLIDRDDSTLRDAVLKRAGKDRIEGVAVVPDQEGLPL